MTGIQMDLYFKSESAQAFAFLRRYVIAVALLLCFSPVFAAFPGERDYLYANESRGEIIHAASSIEQASANSKQSISTQYRAFDGQAYSMTGHSGRYVNLLIPAPVPGELSFTADHVQEMLDRLDLLYALYAEIMQHEPRGSGPINIAFVEQTCGMGCGLLGNRGIEIAAIPQIYQQLIQGLDEGRLDPLLMHEMAHNFDVWSSYLHYLPDHPHAWTDLFEYFAPYRFSREATKSQTAGELFSSPVRDVWQNYLSEDRANWATCVRDQACGDKGLTANNLWAMLYYRIEAIHGPEALLASFRFIKEYAKTHPAPATVQEKEGLRVLSLAVGVQANISCYMDALKWTLPETTRQEMIRRFGNGDALCADLDQDGFSVINGDCDDQRHASNPDRVEVAGNGYDDDCNNLVDELSLVESELGNEPDNFKNIVQTSLPAVISGSSSDPDDSDRFAFDLPATQRTQVKLCAGSGFKGWAAGLNSDGSFLQSPTWYVYSEATGCSTGTFDFSSLPEGQVVMIPDQLVGDYTLTIGTAPMLQPDHSAALQVITNPAGGVTLRVDDDNGFFTHLGTEQLELWVSGAGVQLIRDFTPGMEIQLNQSTAPQLSNGGIYQARVRPRANGSPLAGFATGQLFKYDARKQTPMAVNHTYSGAWFDPEHDGEGFIVEVLDDTSALVYWFTFHADGSQRWLLGMGEVAGDRIIVSAMLDTQGGRFGAGFNPAEVELREAGSLSITFLDCSSALVNYAMDGNGGHQATTRLSELTGHRCGQSNTPGSVDFSGSWYDPSHDGEGFVIEQLSDTEALAFWFTYDKSGRQAWFFNRGNIDGQRISFDSLLQPLGGQFGRSFDPAQVRLHDWGSLTLELDCHGGSAVFDSHSDDYPDGFQSLVALTRLQNSGCGD